MPRQTSHSTDLDPPSRRRPRALAPRRLASPSLAALLLLWPGPGTAQETDPAIIVQNAIEAWRSGTSWALIRMTVHRPSFERSLTLEGWTRGTKDALSRFTDPPKDAGNASLKLDDDMWMFAPKLNQVMKLPSSMMSQSWMGSDFSYDDLARSDRIVVDYDLRLVSTDTADGRTVYTVEGLPKEEAPVVWGKQTLLVRDDWIVLEETYFDQDLEPVRRLTAETVGVLDGRPYATVMRMRDLEEDDHWTEIVYEDARFDIEMPDYLFSLSNLRNPRPWKVK